MRNLLEKLGWPGVMGLGLLLFCLSLFFGHLLPLQDELIQMESEVDEFTETAAAQVPTTLSATAELPLLPLATAPEQLKQLNALATQHGIVIERATYQMKAQAGQTRLEVSMPLHLNYPVLRAYLRDVLAMPATVLEELMLQRAQATDMTVDAQLRLSFGFARTP
ncbi:MAG: hypothetical protein Q8M20_04125 [Rhodocyclaceae bacterium]|nr:hypothetical protein [Rhodocyclaceae bacterium]MDZ4213946.1 hypothetical protein [Rhodocyclaceae bacterium]